MALYELSHVPSISNRTDRSLRFLHTTSMRQKTFTCTFHAIFR